MEHFVRILRFSPFPPPSPSPSPSPPPPPPPAGGVGSSRYGLPGKSSYNSAAAPAPPPQQTSSKGYSNYGNYGNAPSAGAPQQQPSSLTSYSAFPAGMRPIPTPYTPPMRTSPAPPQRISPAPQGTSPSPQGTPTTNTTPQHTGTGSSPFASTNSSPQKQSTTPQKSSSSNGLPRTGGRGQTGMDFDLTDVLSSLPSSNTKKPSKPPSGRGIGGGGDMDLTDVLSSLPSAKPPSGRAPGGRAGTSSAETNKPYQNSTKFVQPQAPPTQRSYQNTTKFNQPQAQPVQSQQVMYQNSTKFNQPALPTQNNYQNSTKFVQPQAPPTQARYQQNSFAQAPPTQPQAPPTQPQAPPLQSSYQNSTKFSLPQAPPPQPQAPPTQVPQGYPSSGRSWSGLANSDPYNHGNQTSSSVPSQQNQDPVGDQKRPSPPAAPLRSSSISRGSVSSQSSVPLSTDQRAHTTSHRAAPLPPTQRQTTPPKPHPSTDSTHSSTGSAPFSSNLGTIDLGDLASSMFSTSAGSSNSASSALSSHTHNSDASSLSHTHPGEEPGKHSEPYSHKLGPSVSIPPLSGGRGPRSQLDRRQNSGDLSVGHVQQGSVDSTPGTPSIHIESPTGKCQYSWGGCNVTMA